MIIRIVDKQGKCIGGMKEEFVHEQNLLHQRLILVMYYGQKMICLKKYKHQNRSDIYDFPVNMHVPIKLSPQELIEKKLQKLGLIKSPIRTLIRNHLFKKKKEFISVYFVKNNNLEIDSFNIIFLHKDEFDFALKRYPEIFSDYVHCINSLGVTFLEGC